MKIFKSDDGQRVCIEEEFASKEEQYHLVTINVIAKDIPKLKDFITNELGYTIREEQ